MYDENKPEEIDIIGWNWQTYTSKADGKIGVVGNFNAMDGRKIPMFLAFQSEKAQYAIKSNLKKLIPYNNSYEIMYKELINDTNMFLYFMNGNDNLGVYPTPKSIIVKKDGNFYKFLKINY
jgi:hypothetical protein